jgi:hypothetical protein
VDAKAKANSSKWKEKHYLGFLLLCLAKEKKSMIGFFLCLAEKKKNQKNKNKNK